MGSAPNFMTAKEKIVSWQRLHNVTQTENKNDGIYFVVPVAVWAYLIDQRSLRFVSFAFAQCECTLLNRDSSVQSGKAIVQSQQSKCVLACDQTSMRFFLYDVCGITSFILVYKSSTVVMC